MKILGETPLNLRIAGHPFLSSLRHRIVILFFALMGAVQVTIGAGFLVRSVALPVIYRLLAGNPANQSGSLALPSTRGVSAR